MADERTTEITSRTRMLIGDEGAEKLSRAHVCVFGVGGVGSYTVEALARAGVGHISLVDSDTVSVTNINRQIIALNSTVGRAKVEVMEERIADINPEIKVEIHKAFVLADNIDEFDFSIFDFVVDAVDTVSAKLAIIEKCKKEGTDVISCMGTGNKLCPEMLKIADINKTRVCPLARVMRRELKNRGIEKLTCVYSEEEPIKPSEGEEVCPEGKRQIPGSISFTPAAAGLLIASHVIKKIIGI